MRSSDTYALTDQLVRQYGTRDPFQMIADMPATRLWQTERFGANGLKGFATIQNRTRYVVVNSLLALQEQKVVAAHELGHIICHEARLKVCTLRDFTLYEETGKLEREANYFAADLLISDEEALDEVRAEGATYFSVAKKLEVPAPFFSYKLFSMAERGMGLRPPAEINNHFLAVGR